MRKLKSRETAPPDFFRYTHPETGHKSKAVDWWTWGSLIKVHRTANNLDCPPNMMEIAEDQLCGTIPPEWCDHADAGKWVNLRFGLDDLKRGMKAFVSLMSGGFDFVPQEEAERRAYICAGCPLNVDIAGCGACAKIGELIVGDVAKQHTQYDNDLRSCAVCHCTNSVKIWFPMRALDTTDRPEFQEAYPEWCWLKKGGAAFKNDGN